MDDNAVHRLGRSVIRAGVSLPIVLLYALAPKPPSGAALALAVPALLLVVVGFRALVKMKTWGVIALGTAGGLLLVSAGASARCRSALARDVGRAARVGRAAVRSADAALRSRLIRRVARAVARRATPRYRCSHEAAGDPRSACASRSRARRSYGVPAALRRQAGEAPQPRRRRSRLRSRPIRRPRSSTSRTARRASRTIRASGIRSRSSRARWSTSATPRSRARTRRRKPTPRSA